MNHSEQIRIASAEPSKKFFTETLPRDIALSDCVLDLVDNSVHSLETTLGLDVSQHYFAATKPPRIHASVDIVFDASRFRLTDDCGGISTADATDVVFLFGNPVKEKTQAGLGVYGIGMKRAFFKIGRQIVFISHTRQEEFRIDIRVEEGEKSKEWNFPFKYARPRQTIEGGTVIEITELHSTVSDQFASKAFSRILQDKTKKAFALFLKAGLTISINGDPASPDVPELAESRNLRPVRHLLKKDGVDILIMAGLSPKADRTPRGWYVFCNGRMVLEADKTEQTGWGSDSHPLFRSKYNHFLGYVYFRSREVQKLPWTTTKEGVDRASPVYQAALAEMRLLSRPVLDFLNDLYPDLKEESEPEHALLKEAMAVSPHRIAGRRNSVFLANVKKEAGDDLVSIQYKRPKKKLDKIREALGRARMSASRIGEHTFDWFYDRNCN